MQMFKLETFVSDFFFCPFQTASHPDIQQADAPLDVGCMLIIHGMAYEYLLNKVLFVC